MIKLLYLGKYWTSPLASIVPENKVPPAQGRVGGCVPPKQVASANRLRNKLPGCGPKPLVKLSNDNNS